MRLEADYVADAEKRARMIGPRNCWTGGEAGLAADVMRFIKERGELLATIDELERKNAELRQAVASRHEAAEVPAEIAALHPNVTFVPAEPYPEAKVEMQRLGGSMTPEQLDAAWGGVRAKSEAVRQQSEPIKTTRVEPVAAALPAPRRTDLIGIAGRAGSGKNAVAGMIPDAFVMQLADPLYAAIAAMLGVPESLLRHQVYKGSMLDGIGKTPRQLLQTLGTEWGRAIVGQDVWLRILERRLKQALAAGVGCVVVADVRFENEAAWIRSRGGEVWHVYRDGVSSDGHASEAGIAIDPADIVIDNSGTIAELRSAVESALAG